MIDGATKEYKFGNKNNWRRWQWNRICDKLQHLGKKPQDAIVLYLAGKDDLDRSVALRKGFKLHNLIALDRDENSIKQLKANGTLAINGTASKVLRCWPWEKPIDVVVLDMCGGLSAELCDCIRAIDSSPVFKSCILAANMLRGRDAFSNGLRAEVASTVIGSQDPNANHRGWCLVAAHLTQFLESNSSKVHGVDAFDKMYMHLKGDPVFESYKSGNLTFDSVVYIIPNKVEYHEQKVAMLKLLGIRYSSETIDRWEAIETEARNAQKKEFLNRSIIATLAVRTRRLNAA